MDAEQFTSDYFSHNIENWTRWLAEYRGLPGVKALEIGSLEGRSAVWLLKNILTGEGSTLDCCDLCQSPWIDRFRHNVAPWGDRVRLHCGHSFDTLRRLNPDHYDIVYVDADHSPAAVLADASLSWPLLKSGGVMIFDDYLWLPEGYSPGGGVWPEWTPEKALEAIAQHPTLAPKTGIDGFLLGMAGHFEVIGQGYQMAIRKTDRPHTDS